MADDKMLARIVIDSVDIRDLETSVPERRSLDRHERSESDLGGELCEGGHVLVQLALVCTPDSTLEGPSVIKFEI